MGSGGFSKVKARWRREREERENRSHELRRRLVERGGPILRSYGVRDAWLFGSVAAGMAELESDLDLLVMPVAADDYWPLRRDLEVAVGCPLDLYTQDDDPTFVKKVMERGEHINATQC